MWLAYIDESGNTGSKLDDPQQPIHFLVAILVPEDQVASMAAQADELVRSAHGSVRRTEAELHGSDLFGGTGIWKALPPAERIAVYRRGLALIGAHEAQVAYASIDKRALAQRWATMPGAARAAPHLLALQFLVEQVNRFLSVQQDPLRRRALLVADETQEHESFALDLVDQMQRDGGPVGRGRRTGNIIDTVHFVRSETSRGVQVADLVAYLMNRVERQAEGRSRPSDVVSDLWDRLVVPHVCARRSRWP